MKLSKTALAIAAVMMMSGCSTLKTHYEEQAFAAHKTPEAKENVAGIDSAKKGEIQKAEQQTFYYYSLSSIESGDLSLEGNRVLHKKVDIEVKDVRLIDALNFLAQEYGFGLIPIVNNQQTLNRKISINAKGVLLANVLRYIETVGNIDLQMKGGTLYVSDLMTLRGSFTRLDMMGDKKSFYETLENNLKKVLVHQKETFYRPPFDDTGKKIAEIKSLLALITSVRSGEGQDATLSNPKPGKDAIKEAAEQLQKKILSGDSDGGVISNDEIFRDFNEIIRQRIKRLALEFAKRDDLFKEGQVRFEPIVMIDKETGSFYIKAEPNLIRQSAPLIENIINSAMATATLKMAIYTVNDSKAREFGLNATKVVQGLYSLSAGGTLDFSDGMLAFQRSHVQKNGDSLDVGVKLLEKIGVLRTETVNTLTLFNGYKTEFKKQYEVGNWVPGDITQQTNTTNGVSTISYSEEKPTFEKEQVGRVISFVPRINMDERRLNLKVQYSDSVIYDKDTFTWNRVAGDKTFPTTIVKPLKAENSVDSAVVLADGEYTILSGVRNASGEINRQGLPGMSDAPILQDIGDNSTKATQEETIIVVKPVFPKRKKVIQIEKSTSF